MTFILDLDVDILRMYQLTKMKFLGQNYQKLDHKRDRHTDRHDRRYYNATFAVGKKQKSA